MKYLLVAVYLLQLLLGAEPSWFKSDDDYVRRVRCMYAFNSSKPQNAPKQLNNASVIYFQLDGVNDTVHYVWSLVGTPTLYMSVSEAADNEHCSESVKHLFPNWEAFVRNQTNGSADLPGIGGDFYFSLVFNRLIEFNDKSYKAHKSFNASDLNNTDTYRPVSLSGLNWTFDGEKMRLEAHESTYNSSKKHQFSWVIQLYVPTKPGRLSRFPKTLHYENSTVFDFVFNEFNYTISSGRDSINYGRLVLEMQMVHGPLRNESKVERVFSRDDEYTPSVFLTYNQRFGGGNGTLDGYLQWKPISYLSSKRKSTQSQQANVINGESIELDEVSPGLVTALYSDTEAGVIQPIYMVFGTEGDDNNANPKYVSWTGMLGFGKRPQDEISLVVIITICVGLGLPTLLIGLGGVFLVIRRKPWKNITSKKRNGGYTKLDINDNDSKYN